MTNFDTYKFHCSSLGVLMTNPRSGPVNQWKTGVLSETTKGELLNIWIEAKYRRTKMDSNKYVEKGLQVEEDGITLYSRVTKKMYTKNIVTFENDFIIGTPDIIHDSIVRDIKCSWSIHSFFENFVKPLSKPYAYQINGYRDLTDCDSGKLVYTLINTPPELVEAEKSKLRYKMALIDPEANGVYNMAVEEIERNNNFDDIPINDRWIEFAVPEIDMGEVYERVPMWRKFMNELLNSKNEPVIV